jgi:hypothetical protein
MVLSRQVALLRIMCSMRVRLAADCVLLCSSSCTRAAAAAAVHRVHAAAAAAAAAAEKMPVTLDRAWTSLLETHVERMCA